MFVSTWKCQMLVYIYIACYGLVHGNELVISTYKIPVCSQHVTNRCMKIHCYQYIRTIRCMFAYKWHWLFRFGFRFFSFLPSSLQIWVSIRVHISLDFVVLTICHSLQIAAVSSSWTVTHMRGFCWLESILCNKLLGNTYVKSLQHLPYFDSIFTWICIY